MNGINAAKDANSASFVIFVTSNNLYQSQLCGQGYEMVGKGCLKYPVRSYIACFLELSSLEHAVSFAVLEA